MKKFGKRTLSMLLAFALTASMLISDLSVMQVNAAGSVDFTADGESSTVEIVTEELTVEETVSEEASSVEESEEAGEESSTDVVSEETTEASSEETAVEETTAVETTTEEITVEETIVVETVTEETAVEEMTTEAVTVEETTVEAMEEVPGAVEVAAAPQFTIGADADGVMTVTFEEGVTKLSGEVVIPKEVKIIPCDGNFFSTNMAVTKVTFEEGSLLERIEDRAFFSTQIAEIKLPESVTYIGNEAFCTSKLTKVTLVAGTGKVELGKQAFYSNSGLKTFVTNGRLEKIGELAFAESDAFRYFVTSESSSNTSENPLVGVTTIGESAFAGCKSLEYIEIPLTVTEIKKETFKNCTSLGKSDIGFYTGSNAVNLGYGVKTIGDSAFAGCTGLEKIILQKNVEVLGDKVFDGCTSLKNIRIYNCAGSDETDACAIALTYTSFPFMKGLVLEAYDGTVKDWAEDHYNLYKVEFKTLYKEYNITYSDEIKNGTIKTNVKKAKMGEPITLTITPEEGYTLKYGSLYYEDLNGVPGRIIDEYDCMFEMPEFDVKIYGEFVKTSELQYGDKLVIDSINGLSNKTDDNISYDAETQTLEFPKAWQNVRIKVIGSNGKTPVYSELKFKSDKEKVVTIDERGNMRALAKGTANITVSLVDESKGVKPLTFAVDVREKTFVSSLSLSYDAPKVKKIEMAENEDDYDVITYSASRLTMQSYEMTVQFAGIDEGKAPLDVQYQLSSNDNAVAKPKAAKAIGEGIIVIPKGALGETVITVKALDGADKPATKQFIIRVIDDTPRLANSSVTVDPQSENGTLLDLVSVYGGSPDVSNLSVVKKITKNGTTSWEDVETGKLFKINDVNGELYLQALETEDTNYREGQKYTYKNKYYIAGKLNDSGTVFYIPIPTLTVYKKNIKPSIKMSGKINLFYNGNLYEQYETLDDALAVIGSVKVTQNQKDLVVKNCVLEGKENTNGENTNDDDAFVENFAVDFNEEKQTIRIIRTVGDEALTCYSEGKSKGKPVLTGDLLIYYEGYTEPVRIKNITVPTQTSVPAYKMNISKISLHKEVNGQAYDVSFINKKTKQVEDITDQTVIEVDELAGGTTLDLIEYDGDTGRISANSETDTVQLKFVKPNKGKVVLKLRQPYWEDQSKWNKKTTVKTTITVSATSSWPTAKLGKGTLTLNRACPDAKDYTTMKLSHSDFAFAENFEFTPVNAEKSENLQVSFDCSTGQITAEITGAVNKGIHSFYYEPEYTFTTNGIERTRTVKKVTVKVKVNDTQPSIKLKNANYTINAQCYNDGDGKYDKMTRTFIWSNLPAEYSKYSLNTDEMKLEYQGRKGTDPFEEGTIDFVIDAAEKTAMVSIESQFALAGKGTYKVTGLQLVSDGSAPIPVKDFKITINSINKTPAVTVKAKGAINPLDPTSKIEYTPKLANINGTVEDVLIREFDGNGDRVPTEDMHFTATHDITTGKTIVQVKPENKAQLEKSTYTIQFYYKLSNSDGNNGIIAEYYKVTKDQKITPKQTMPKISIDKKSATFFAGNKERPQTITITKKSTAAAEIVGVKISEKTPEKLREAFTEPGYNPVNGEVELKLNNSAFIKQNVEQTLTLEIVCDGQLKDTTGTTFSVKVKVIK